MLNKLETKLCKSYLVIIEFFTYSITYLLFKKNYNSLSPHVSRCPKLTIKLNIKVCCFEESESEKRQHIDG